MVTNWPRSASVRPRQGRISAALAGDEVRAVELGRDVRGQARGAAARSRYTQYPESPRGSFRRARRRPSPCRRASRGWPVTVSRPCWRGGSSRIALLERVEEGGLRLLPDAHRADRPARWSGRAPGTTPAPGLPIEPRNSSRFTTSCTLATAFACWVSPIAQQTMMRSVRARSAAVSRICFSETPLPFSISSQLSVAQVLRVRQPRTLGAVARRSSSIHRVRARSRHLSQPLEERDVAVDAHLQEEVARAPCPPRSERLLRMLEAMQARLAQRVDADDLRPRALRPAAAR